MSNVSGPNPNDPARHSRHVEQNAAFVKQSGKNKADETEEDVKARQKRGKVKSAKFQSFDSVSQAASSSQKAGSSSPSEQLSQVKNVMLLLGEIMNFITTGDNTEIKGGIAQLTLKAQELHIDNAQLAKNIATAKSNIQKLNNPPHQNMWASIGIALVGVVLGVVITMATDGAGDAALPAVEEGVEGAAAGAEAAGQSAEYAGDAAIEAGEEAGGEAGDDAVTAGRAAKKAGEEAKTAGKEAEAANANLQAAEKGGDKAAIGAAKRAAQKAGARAATAAQKAASAAREAATAAQTAAPDSAAATTAQAAAEGSEGAAGVSSDAATLAYGGKVTRIARTLQGMKYLPRSSMAKTAIMMGTMATGAAGAEAYQQSTSVKASMAEEKAQAEMQMVQSIMEVLQNNITQTQNKYENDYQVMVSNATTQKTGMQQGFSQAISSYTQTDLSTINNTL